MSRGLLGGSVGGQFVSPWLVWGVTSRHETKNFFPHHLSADGLYGAEVGVTAGSVTNNFPGFLSMAHTAQRWGLSVGGKFVS